MEGDDDSLTEIATGYGWPDMSLSQLKQEQHRLVHLQKQTQEAKLCTKQLTQRIDYLQRYSRTRLSDGQRIDNLQAQIKKEVRAQEQWQKEKEDLEKKLAELGVRVCASVHREKELQTQLDAARLAISNDTSVEASESSTPGVQICHELSLGRVEGCGGDTSKLPRRAGTNSGGTCDGGSGGQTCYGEGTATDSRRLSPSSIYYPRCSTTRDNACLECRTCGATGLAFWVWCCGQTVSSRAPLCQSQPTYEGQQWVVMKRLLHVRDSLCALVSFVELFLVCSWNGTTERQSCITRANAWLSPYLPSQSCLYSECIVLMKTRHLSCNLACMCIADYVTVRQISLVTTLVFLSLLAVLPATVLLFVLLGVPVTMDYFLHVSCQAWPLLPNLLHQAITQSIIKLLAYGFAYPLVHDVLACPLAHRTACTLSSCVSHLLPQLYMNETVSDCVLALANGTLPGEQSYYSPSLSVLECAQPCMSVWLVACSLVILYARQSPCVPVDLLPRPHLWSCLPSSPDIDGRGFPHRALPLSTWNLVARIYLCFLHKGQCLKATAGRSNVTCCSCLASCLLASLTWHVCMLVTFLSSARVILPSVLLS